MRHSDSSARANNLQYKSMTRVYAPQQFGLLAYDQNFKLPCLACREKKFVRLGIESHGLGFWQSLDGFDGGILVGAIFVNRADCAFAIRVEDHHGLGIESGRVDVIADRQRGDDFAGVGVHHRHDFAAAADEEAVVGCVHGNTTRRGTRSGGPALLHFQIARVNFENQALIFQIVVNKAAAVSNGIFRTTTQIDGSSDFSGGGINGRCAIAAAVKGENSRGRRIENDGVGLFAGRYVGDRLESLQIENRDVGRLSIAGESATEVVRDGDAVNAHSFRNVSYD